MSTSEHILLAPCHVVGDRAGPLPTSSHKTDVVASVLPAPSARGRTAAQDSYRIAIIDRRMLSALSRSYLVANAIFDS